MPFTFESTILPGVKIIAPKVFPDGRGFFFESYKSSEFQKAGICESFIQDNHSRSSGSVLRGLHYQKDPHAQAKILRVLSGAIYDVVLDMRKGSPSFGKWIGVELSAENKKMIYVPSGFAHGFASLAENVEIHYKVSSEYCKESEAGVRWNDPALGINWPLKNPVLSEKDSLLPPFAEADNNFIFKGF